MAHIKFKPNQVLERGGGSSKKGEKTSTARGSLQRTVAGSEEKNCDRKKKAIAGLGLKGRTQPGRGAGSPAARGNSEGARGKMPLAYLAKIKRRREEKNKDLLMCCPTQKSFVKKKN